MSVNKYTPHVLVLPEDDANRQIAGGFLLEPDLRERSIQILPEAGGWRAVLDVFTSDHVADMRKVIHRHMVLLIDFDRDEERLRLVRAAVPGDLADRVFVLGAWSEPEALRRSGLGTYEEIGKQIAVDCRDNSSSTWKHDLLRHNEGELARMITVLRPILFRLP